jgi:hypothetical protein
MLFQTVKVQGPAEAQHMAMLQYKRKKYGGRVEDKQRDNNTAE